jgi:hypothetical protein
MWLNCMWTIYTNLVGILSTSTHTKWKQNFMFALLKHVIYVFLQAQCTLNIGVYMAFTFVGLAYQGKDIVFRFIISTSGYQWRSDTIRPCPARPCRARPCPAPSLLELQKERRETTELGYPGRCQRQPPETHGPCSGPPVAKSLVYGPGPGSSWGDRASSLPWFNTYSHGSIHLGTARPAPSFF